MANIDEAFEIELLSLNNNALLVSAAADPTIGVGYEAPLGSLYLRTTGALYIKTTTADVGWTMASAGGTTIDELVKISVNDTTAGLLIDKLAVGTNISLVETNDGSNETLTVNVLPDNFDSLTDVVITGPVSTNSTITWNGTSWVNSPAPPPPPSGGSLTVQIKFGPISGISGTTQIPRDTTAPLITEGTEIWSDIINIQELGSTINIATAATISASTASLEFIFSVFRDTTCIGVSVNSTSNKSSGFAVSFEMYDVPGIIGPTTYSVRVGKTVGSSGTWFLNSLHSNQPQLFFNGLLENNSYKIAEIGTTA